MSIGFKRQDRRGKDALGSAGIGMAWQARTGRARSAVARLGRNGGAWARNGMARHSRPAQAVRGAARRVKDRQATHGVGHQ